MTDWWPLRLEARAQAARHMTYLSPLLALALCIVLAALLFAALGKDPVAGLNIFLLAPLANPSELLLKTTPLVLCALGLSLCYRANVWNIGAEGQLIAGGLAAGSTILYFDHGHAALSGSAALTLALAAGVAGGALWAGLTAWLRDSFHANEILVSLMLSYVAQLLLMYAVNGPLKDPDGMNFPQSKVFSADFVLPHLFAGSRLHIGVPVTVLAAVAMAVFMFRSFAGFRLNVGGLAPHAARYAGFSSRNALWLTLLLSGGLAGLAGAFEVTGPIGQVLPSISPGYGFAAIIVAFAGRLHPLGCVLGGLLLSLFYLGGEMAQSRLGLPAAMTGLFQGMLLFSLLACDTLIYYRVRRK